jgi:hypothetical protein
VARLQQPNFTPLSRAIVSARGYWDEHGEVLQRCALQVLNAVKNALAGLLPGRSKSDGNVGALSAIKEGAGPSVQPMSAQLTSQRPHKPWSMGIR